MIVGTPLIAGSQPANGRVVLAIGLVMLAVSVAEIVTRTRWSAGSGRRMLVWAGRLFAVAVWLLMIAAGIKLLVR